MSVTEQLEKQRRDVFLSRASSRKELAATVHDLILPELQRLGGNDKVSQAAIKAIVAGMQAQGDEIIRLCQKVNAIETMSFGARLKWAFTFSQKQETNGASGPADSDRDIAAAAGAADTAV